MKDDVASKLKLSLLLLLFSLLFRALLKTHVNSGLGLGLETRSNARHGLGGYAPKGVA